MKILILFCLQTIALSLFAQNGNKSTLPQPGYTKEVEAKIRRIENGLMLPVAIKGIPKERIKLLGRMRYYGTPAVSIAVINNGKLEWARGYGVKEFGSAEPVTTETLFSAGSISKPVAAMGALHLVEEGKLNLDEDVNLKLVSWTIPENEFTKQSKVTLRRLLNHTSGFGLGGGAGKTWNPNEPFPTLVQALNGTPPAEGQPARVEFVPNCRWAYSSTGYAVAQLLMMDVTQKPFPRLMQEIVFSKLNMTKSTFENPLPSRYWSQAATGYTSSTGNPIENKYPSTAAMAAGGLWTTPSDLARFAMQLQKIKTGQSTTVLTKESANLMLTPFRAGWGLGLEINTQGRTPWFSHSGGMPGFTALMVAYQWEGKGAVVMISQDTYNGFQLANEIMMGIAREYGWKDYVPLEMSIGKSNPLLYKDYEGYYEIDQGYPVTIVARNNKLYLIWALGNVFEMFPMTESKFFIAREGAPTFEFVRDSIGGVAAIKREWNGGVSQGKKTVIPSSNSTGNISLQLDGFQHALTVAVTGSFNNWNSREILCSKTKDGWKCNLELKPGKYLYRFVVDNKPIPDPKNRQTETDSEGNVSSVLIIK